MELSKKKNLLKPAITASLQAGKEIMEVYSLSDFGIQLKSDNSPVTIADQRAHQAIVSVLGSTNIPILSEEGEHLDYAIRKEWKLCWIVDPLDGTKEFIKQNNEFTVNIALVENGKPIAGVIYVPVSKQLYFADQTIGAFRADQITNWDENLEQLKTNSKSLPLTKSRNKSKIVGSRSHMNQETKEFIESLQQENSKTELVSRGSSLKMCIIAEGKADIYPRFATIMEWDTAAGHAIVAASGGKVVHVRSEKELTYNKENLQNPWFICKR